jgi:hypothetical protein
MTQDTSPMESSNIKNKGSKTFIFISGTKQYNQATIKIKQVVHTLKNTHMKFQLNPINKSLGQILQKYLFSD